MANYPFGVSSFTTKNPGDTIQAAHINDLQAEVTALETALFSGIIHNIAIGGTLTTTNTITSGGVVIALAATVTNPAYFSGVNAGGSFFAGLDNSTGGSFGFGNYRGVLYTSGATGLAIVAAHASGPIGFYTGGTGLRAQINANGTQTWAPYGAGTATFDASGNITSVSDLREKDVVGPYTTGLAAVCALQPIRFRWKAKADGLDRGRTYIGFGAQDVLPWLPDAIDQHWLPDPADATAIGEDRYSFNALVVLAALVNAVRDLTARVEALDQQPLPPLAPVADLSAAIGLDPRAVKPDEQARRLGTGRFPGARG